VALGDHGKVLLKKKFSQKHLIAFTATMQTSLIGMETCSGAHLLGRALRVQGHDAKLIPAQFVKPFVTSNKNDFIDAEAIAEAVDRKNMRFVPTKTEDLDLQAMHRVRERLMIRRTSVVNQIRAFLLRSKRDRIAMGSWITSLEMRAPQNVLIIAMANKLARIAWAVLSTGQAYRGVPDAMTM
jgi:transposase